VSSTSTSTSTTTTTTATPHSGHAAVPAVSLDVGRRLMAFNWMTAGYAHRDWLGPWAEILEPRHKAGVRMMRRASIVLLNRYQLRERYVRDLGQHAWLLQPHGVLMDIANALGVAMLGGWVMKRLERQEVALQVRVLGADGRQQALAHAKTLRALPFAPEKTGWPVTPTGAATTLRLGLSCLAAVLDDESTGARERLTLRFPSGMVVPLQLSQAQRDEALALIHAAVADKTEVT
jgi:YOP proteins translocation protein K (YscK)